MTYALTDMRRDSRRSLKAHRAFKLRRDLAEITGSLARIFSRSTSSAAVSLLLVAALPALIATPIYG
jgi:hypothetical protein